MGDLKMKTSVKAIVEKHMAEGLSEGAIRAFHPELNPDSIRGAAQRYKRKHGLNGNRAGAPKTWLYLAPETVKALQAQADRRGVLSRDLAAQLLHKILSSGTVADVLGECDG